MHAHAAQSAHGHGAFFAHTLGLALFCAIAVSWPGAVLLSILYIVAAYGAVVAAVNLHMIMANQRKTWLLQWLGVFILAVGVGLLVGVGGAAAILPTLFAAWLVARSRNAWSLTSATVVLAFGLLFLSSFGDHAANVLALTGVHALTTGTLLIGLSPRPPAQPSIT
jgi:hypothetical protein